MKDTKYKRATIYDVAEYAQVSHGTVSRYINGIGVPKEENRLKIEAAIKELQYTPNRAAQSLKSKKNNIICLAYPESEDPFFYQLMASIQAETKKRGYALMVYHTNADTEEELNILSLMDESFADGLILINYNFTSRHLEAFNKIECPLVISSLCISPYGGTGLDNFDYVGIDGRNALFMSTTNMIENGHRKISFVGGSKDIVVFREQFEGYMSALTVAGIPPDNDYCFFGDYDKAFGYKIGTKIANMDTAARPTAICTVNDITAIGLMTALRDNNIKIPDDIAVIGVDNISFDVDLNPKLSSVDLLQNEICKCAVNFLIQRINGEDTPAKKIIFQPKLITRGSSAKVFN